MAKKTKKDIIYWFGWDKKKDKDVLLILWLPIAVLVLTWTVLFLFNFSEMDRSTWNYAISTYTQSLAAILALNATFVTFKLLSIKQEKEKYKDRIIAFLVTYKSNKESNFYDKSDNNLLYSFKKEIKVFAPAGFLVEFFGKYEGRNLGGEHQSNALHNWKNHFSSTLENERAILGFLKEFLKLSGFVIIINSLLLSFSDAIFFIADPYFLLTEVTILFGISIYYIVTKTLKIF